MAKGKVQRILILKDTICDGVPVSRGDTVEAGEEDARLLINLKKAVDGKAEIEAHGAEIAAEKKAAAEQRKAARAAG